MKVRLQRFLAEAGLGSRRSCEELITAGRVTVDGRKASLGESIQVGAEQVRLDGEPVTVESKEYWLLNKPKGVLSASVDSRGRRTVVDCVPTKTRVYPVGRLDLDTTGLLLLTNDGALAERLLHPRYHVDKQYLVIVKGAVAESAIDALRRGVTLEDGTTSPASVERLPAASQGSRQESRLTVTLREGRKRQVKRMFEAVGHRVVSLHRARFASLVDDDLPVGKCRRLTQTEIDALRRTADLD